MSIKDDLEKLYGDKAAAKAQAEVSLAAVESIDMEISILLAALTGLKPTVKLETIVPGGLFFLKDKPPIWKALPPAPRKPKKKK